VIPRALEYDHARLTSVIQSGLLGNFFAASSCIRAFDISVRLHVVPRENHTKYPFKPSTLVP
jgi:hypothetical protein